MNKAKNVVEYYVLCNKLKETIRQGWLDWQVKKERLGSVAEHIYGVMMLAIAIDSEYDYDIDIKKVLMMIAIHELEEIYVGDISIKAKPSIEDRHECVLKVLKNLAKKDELMSLIIEFDERKTNEARFAYYCDKLESDLQCKIYDEMECVNLNDPNCFKDPWLEKYYDKNMSWSKMWMTNDQEYYNYDNNFKEISNYAMNNKIKKDGSS